MHTQGTAPRPHDLLWIADRRALYSSEPLPEWVTETWVKQAPVVFRRERVTAQGRVPVGLRGLERNQRFGAYMDTEAITRRVTPESLVRQTNWSNAGIQKVPAIEALGNLTRQLDALGLTWGPTGSVGFALASGLPVLRDESDLDIVIRSVVPLSPEHMQLLQSVAKQQVCRIDIQIDTGRGGFSFAEWAAKQANEREQILLKTDDGPFLVQDPWLCCIPAQSRAA